MLKGISPMIGPELLKILAEMGHGDELVLADGNFPGTSIGQRCVRCDGHGCAEVMRAVLQIFPLNDFVPAPLAVMEVPDGMFPGNQAPIWQAFREAADAAVMMMTDGAERAMNHYNAKKKAREQGAD